MRTSEWIAVAYLGYLVLTAWVVRLPLRRRIVATLSGGANVAVVWWIAHPATRSGSLIRDWFPALQILAGYWLSGLFYQRPMLQVESWLLRFDRWLFDRAGLRTLLEHAPRALLELFDAAYAGINFFIPIVFGLVYVLVPGLDVDRYWTIVLTSELACYGMLPWIQTRTPRELGDQLARPPRALLIRRVNHFILRHASIQANTVPSGHSAGALATALASAELMPAAAVVLFPVALMIAAGSVVGRYHYAADAMLGWVVAVGVWLGVPR